MYTGKGWGGVNSVIKMGILGCADIAYRRFLPAAGQMEQVKAAVIAEEYDKSRLDRFRGFYGLQIEESFEQVLQRPDIDAVYIPQPPAFHALWAKKALEYGKHVLLEKPAACSLEDVQGLVACAREKRLVLHENYAFLYHAQIGKIKELLAKDRIGELRLIRTNFCFPFRGENDFRYRKELGGGALLDAGGYPVKLASILLGSGIRVEAARLNYRAGYEVDLFGSATLSDDTGTVCQMGFGMDCFYQCSLEMIGSTGRIFTDRIFTAPQEYQAVLCLETSSGKERIYVLDSAFVHSIAAFAHEIQNDAAREAMYHELLIQAELIADIHRKGIEHANYI